MKAIDVVPPLRIRIICAVCHIFYEGYDITWIFLIKKNIFKTKTLDHCSTVFVTILKLKMQFMTFNVIKKWKNSFFVFYNLDSGDV